MLGPLLLLVLFAACPNDPSRTTLWLTFGATGLALIDHEPPPY